MRHSESRSGRVSVQKNCLRSHPQAAGRLAGDAACFLGSSIQQQARKRQRSSMPRGVDEDIECQTNEFNLTTVCWVGCWVSCCASRVDAFCFGSVSVNRIEARAEKVQAIRCAEQSTLVFTEAPAKTSLHQRPTLNAGRCVPASHLAFALATAEQGEADSALTIQWTADRLSPRFAKSLF